MSISMPIVAALCGALAALLILRTAGANRFGTRNAVPTFSPFDVGVTLACVGAMAIVIGFGVYFANNGALSMPLFVILVIASLGLVAFVARTLRRR